MMFTETNRTRSEHLTGTIYPDREWFDNKLRPTENMTAVEKAHLATYIEWLDQPSLDAFDSMNYRDLHEGQAIVHSTQNTHETVPTDRPPLNRAVEVTHTKAAEVTEIVLPHIVRAGLGHLSTKAAGTIIDVSLPDFPRINVA